MFQRTVVPVEQGATVSPGRAGRRLVGRERLERELRATLLGERSRRTLRARMERVAPDVTADELAASAPLVVTVSWPCPRHTSRARWTSMCFVIRGRLGSERKRPRPTRCVGMRVGSERRLSACTIPTHTRRMCPSIHSRRLPGSPRSTMSPVFPCLPLAWPASIRQKRAL